MCVCVCVCACSVMSDSLRPQGLAHQAPLSMKLSRQGYWSRLLFLPPRKLPSLWDPAKFRGQGEEEEVAEEKRWCVQ